MQRNFGFTSIFGFAMILLSTWESVLGLVLRQVLYRSSLLTKYSTALFGLSNGGTAGLIYVYLGTAIGFAAVIASMAEMASM